MAPRKTGLVAGHLASQPRFRPRGRQSQRGFALLLVFLMAAVLAITLYMELPRVAMQSQRDKEQILIDRGEQYKRAIQLFVNKAKRYPGDIKELENFQNQRFLRHRYVDPMTGKDEWRLIHVNNGVLTDSKLTKPNGPGGKEDPKTPNGFVGEQVGLGGIQNPTLGGGAANVRDRRRASDGANATMPGPALPGGDVSGGQNSGVPPLPGQTPDNGQPTLPGTLTNPTGQPGLPGLPGQPGQPVYPPGMTVPGQTLPGQSGIPGLPIPIPVSVSRGSASQPGNPSSSGGSFVGGGGSFVGGSSSFVGGGTVTPTTPGMSTYPGQTLPGQPGMPVNSQTQGVSPYPISPGSNGMPPGFPQPGTTPGTGNSAADMIRGILTTPRPGGMPQANPGGGQVFGGGIAGVATTAEGEGVKVYNDRTLYQEWEFIFDPAKQKQIPNPNATGLGGTPAGQLGQPGQQGQQPGGPGMGPISPQTARPPGQ